MAAAWECTDFGSNAITVMTDSAKIIRMLCVICVTRVPGADVHNSVQRFPIESRGDGKRFQLPCTAPHCKGTLQYDPPYPEISMQYSIYKSIIPVAFAAITVAAVPASRISFSSDSQFIDRMTAHLTRDLELARTAEANAQLPALKSFAAVLMTEREDQLNDLAGIRSRLAGGGSGAPETRTAPSAQLGNSSDRAMIDQFVRRHRAAIVLARSQAANGKDAELNAFARRLTYSENADLPELQQMRAAMPGTSGGK